MKRSLVWMTILIVLLSVAAMGCSRTQKVIATQDGITAPYESLGFIEVNRKAPRIQCRRMFGQVWEWMTFGHSKNISEEAYLERKLDKKLIKAAKKIQKAEKVINVTYWPNLKEKKFPEGRIYARGEAIVYKRFPK